jgi:cold shock CspA family protein
LNLRRFDEAQEIVRALLTVLLSEKWQKTVFDLMLQVFQRRAEYFVSRLDYGAALEALDGLRNAFENIPPDLVDTKMFQKMSRARGVARFCSRSIAGTQRKARALELETWFLKILNEPQSVQADNPGDMHGQIARWYPDRKFRFVVRSDGREFFFHFSSIISPHDEADVLTGAHVVFNTTPGAKGERAVNVEIRDLAHEAGL